VTPSRRSLIGGLGGLAVGGCGRPGSGQAQAEPTGHFPPSLKAAASFPIGCAVTLQHLNDPVDAAILTRHFSQITAEWEMKMEYILRDDGGFRFDAPDAIAAYARAHGLRLFGHNLIWYAQSSPAFERIDGQAKPFADAYRNYILAVAGRYRGQAVGWDVVNEPVLDDGSGLRDCLWSRNLGGTDYIRRALDHAREADPGAVLFINDYNLESLPRKRATFMRLVESLLKAGAPIGGIGTQTHLATDLPPGTVTTALRDLASLGLPIHVSELDISLNRDRGLSFSAYDKPARQYRLAHEVAEAFASLPAALRFGFTLWGLRDGESWLRSAKENPSPPWDTPLVFDDSGRAKPMLAALAAGFAARD
jgi:endo-1,4-beta-xylanase